MSNCCGQRAEFDTKNRCIRKIHFSSVLDCEKCKMVLHVGCQKFKQIVTKYRLCIRFSDKKVHETVLALKILSIW